MCFSVTFSPVRLYRQQTWNMFLFCGYFGRHERRNVLSRCVTCAERLSSLRSSRVADCQQAFAFSIFIHPLKGKSLLFPLVCSVLLPRLLDQKPLRAALPRRLTAETVRWTSTSWLPAGVQVRACWSPSPPHPSSVVGMGVTCVVVILRTLVFFFFFLQAESCFARLP